jgi:hypothetical protein
MAQQVLVDRLIARQQDCQTLIAAATTAPGLLPGTGNRAGIVDQQGGIE